MPADADGKVPTGYGFWYNAWPENPAWKFVAVGRRPRPGCQEPHSAAAAP
ncbi:hypothetical protein [Streptomyces sp. SD31]